MEVGRGQAPARPDRRGWLISAARLAVFGSILGLGGGLWLKSRRLGCSGRSACGQCSLRGFCPLPEAAGSRRKEQG